MQLIYDYSVLLQLRFYAVHWTRVQKTIEMCALCAHNAGSIKLSLIICAEIHRLSGHELTAFKKCPSSCRLSCFASGDYEMKLGIDSLVNIRDQSKYEHFIAATFPGTSKLAYLHTSGSI